MRLACAVVDEVVAKNMGQMSFVEEMQKRAADGSGEGNMLDELVKKNTGPSIVAQLAARNSSDTVELS